MVMEKTQADEIREFVYRNYIQPARQRGETQITIRAYDIHKQMKLEEKLPAVCSALGTDKFQKMYNVTLLERKGPTNAANVYFTFGL